MARPRNSELVPDLFYFWRHDPGEGPLREDIWKLKFHAHITNISDSSSPSWNTNFDMGRADPKVFYQNYARSISISFLVVAINKEEHDANQFQMEKLGLLTYPLYQPGNGYNAPHVFYLIGSLMQGYGVITNLDYTWSSDYPWIEKRPLYTEVSLTIMKLADGQGFRPSTDSSYFN